MTVQELIDILLEIPQKDAKVVVSVGNGDGCGSCGYGESYSERDVVRANDLTNRIVLDFE